VALANQLCDCVPVVDAVSDPWCEAGGCTGGVAAAEAAAGVAAVNFALSDRHATRHLEDALLRGLIGDVLSVEIRLAFTQWPRDFQAHAGWLDGRAQGGFVREVLSHFIYLTDRLLGPVQPVDLVLDHRPGDDVRSEVAAWGLLRAGGVPVQVGAVAGAAGHRRTRSHLYADELAVQVGGEPAANCC